MMIQELLGFDDVKGDVGIEIEAESLEPVNWNENHLWRFKGDGSLRHIGYEFITKEPLTHGSKEKTEAIRFICDQLQHKSVIKNSPRTSVHVHINCLHLTALQIWTFITAYYLLENVLVQFSGEGRVGNLFCLRLKDAQKSIDYIVNDFKKGLPFLSFNLERCKYAAGNLASLQRLGTFEVRSMRGEYSTELIDLWSNELVNIRENSKKFKTPAILLDAYWNIGDRILEELVSKDFAQILRIKYPRLNDMLSEASLLVASFAYAQNWDLWQDKIPVAKPKPRRPRLDPAVEAPPQFNIQQNWQHVAQAPINRPDLDEDF